jgi:hypothetical protein
MISKQIPHQHMLASQPDGGFESFTLSKNPNRHGIGITRQDPYFEVGAFMDLACVSQNKILNVYLRVAVACMTPDRRSGAFLFLCLLYLFSQGSGRTVFALGESFQGHRKGAPFESFKLPVRIECQLRNYFSCLRMASIGSISWYETSLGTGEMDQ